MERQSNMEAMRVTAMALVVMVHCVYLANGDVMPLGKTLSFGGSYFFSLMEAFALVCCNCFVLITGYFGMRTRFRSVINLLFVVYFWKTLLYVCALIAGTASFDAQSLYVAYLQLGGDWFIWAYLGLMLFAPMLNAFVDNAPRKTVLAFLVIYYTIMLVTPLSASAGMGFEGGCSTFFFIALYLAGRYYRKYLESDRRIKAWMGIALYVGSAMLSTLILTTVYYFNIENLKLSVFCRFMGYNSPFVVAGSLGLMIFFSRITLKGKLINWLGASAFSVYLFHLSPWIRDYFMDGAQLVFRVGWPWGWVPLMLCYIAVVYLVAAIIDQLRIAVWRRIDRYIPK